MGTWAAPQTLGEASKLARLMKKPIASSGANMLIFNLIGEDVFWDIVDSVAVFEPDTDIRPLIASILYDWIDGKINTWKYRWDPKAVDICKDLARQHYDWYECKRLNKFYRARLLKWEVEKIEKERGIA